jgi:signal peptidase I
MTGRHDAASGAPPRLPRRYEPGHDVVKRSLPLWAEIPILVAISVVTLVLVRSFLFQVFYIPSPSMERTLQCGDRVAVNRLAGGGDGPSRGDVIVFRGWRSANEDKPPRSFGESLRASLAEGLPFLSGGGGPDAELVKRVVALPGEKVQVVDSRAIVDGEEVDGEWVFVDGVDATADFGPVEVPDGAYFVLGDHRNDSADSRQNGGQFVDADRVVGRVSARIWPPSRIGGLDGGADGPPRGPGC